MKKADEEMKRTDLHILQTALLKNFLLQVNKNLLQEFEELRDSELSIETFSFYTSVSAVFSSKIEGENIDLDSFINYKRFGIEYLPDYTKKIDDLYNAYLFAQKSKPNIKNIEEAHSILTQNILPEKQRGKIRSGNMFVVTADGKIEYVAADQNEVAREIKKLYHDIELLIETELNPEEVFFFESMIHLVFVKIHPFDDGNGRMARLIEKWFLSQKLGSRAWFIQSEKYYYIHHQTYYHKLRLLGLEYPELDYLKELPFLEMLPDSLMQVNH